MGLVAGVTSLLVSAAGGVEAIGVAGVMVANTIATIATSFAISGVSGLLGEAGGYNVHDGGAT